MWLNDEQIEIVGVLTNISIGMEDLVFQAKFVADDKFTKWGEFSDIYVQSFNATKQKTIDKITDKIENRYLSLLNENIDQTEILDRITEELLIELTNFEKRVRGYLEFHQLKLINDYNDEKILWQSDYFDDIYIDRFFDVYD